MLFLFRLHLTIALSIFLTTTAIATLTPQNPYNYYPIVTLDYGTFHGNTSTEYNLTYFRKIPFGASTAGKNRFRAPQPPVPLDRNVTYNSDQPFDMCPQRTVNGSEDCLYLGVYSRPWTPAQALRPVLLTFYGGGFIRGSASFNIPPSGFPVLDVDERNDYVVLYSNYRTNVFGFLSGTQIAQHPDTDLNVGLLDQQAALLWIQKYIHHFGGDRTNVTIWGQSAGGGSVVAQSIATGNRGKGLFTKAMSSSPFWPKTYHYDSPQSEALFNETVQDVGCGTADDKIACLKSADLQALRESALRLSTSAQYTTNTFTWGPVIDNEFLTESLGDVIRNKQTPLNAELLLTSYNLHEGETFVPPGFKNATGDTNGFNSSSASFDAWLQGFLPDFTTDDLDMIKGAYPNTGTMEQLAQDSTYNRAGLIYRDLVLSCPAYWLATKSCKAGSMIEYTIAPAQHASDVQYWNEINPIQKSDPLTYEAYAGAMASFVQTGDPNVHKVTDKGVPGVPDLRDQRKFLITAEGVRQDGVDALERKCEVWLEVARQVPI